ncbi:MAG: hypothetical protein KDD64_05685 [Bdellovibrionales bacterium]|nr:hypothetical protein [Bdellovibrionales bacterium]
MRYLCFIAVLSVGLLFGSRALTEQAKGTLSVSPSSIVLQDGVAVLGDREFESGKPHFKSNIVVVYLFREILSESEKEAVRLRAEGRKDYDGVLRLVMREGEKSLSLGELEQYSISFAKRDGGLSFDLKSTLLQIQRKRVFGETAPDVGELFGALEVGQVVTVKVSGSKMSFTKELAWDLSIRLSLRESPWRDME